MNYVKIKENLFINVNKDVNGNYLAIIRNSPSNKGTKLKLNITYPDSVLNLLKSNFINLNNLNKKGFNNAVAESEKINKEHSVIGLKEILTIQEKADLIEKQIMEKFDPHVIQSFTIQTPE